MKQKYVESAETKSDYICRSFSKLTILSKVLIQQDFFSKYQSSMKVCELFKK